MHIKIQNFIQAFLPLSQPCVPGSIILNVFIIREILCCPCVLIRHAVQFPDLMQLSAVRHVLY